MVTRADVEAKARELQQAVAQTKEAAMNTAVLAGVVVVVMVVIAYWLGRRKGGRSRAVVEVYRV
jgi:membrane protein required for beta-lactamase induction